MSSRPVMWAELQNAMSAAGLNVVVDIPAQGCWSGTIDDKMFVMSIEGKDDDGFHPYMAITLLGQDEATVLPTLVKFMGYSPFVRYHNKRIEQPNVTFEWAKNAAEGFERLSKDDMLDQIEKLAEGFTLPVPPGPEEHFQQLTPEIVESWRSQIGTDPEATFGTSKISDMLPFADTVLPRFAKMQSLFGPSIICIEGPRQDVEAIVNYGLEPLLTAHIINEADVEAITNWFNATPPRWDGSRNRGFRKTVEVGGKQYVLSTDDYRNCRDLNIRPA